MLGTDYQHRKKKIAWTDWGEQKWLKLGSWTENLLDIEARNFCEKHIGLSIVRVTRFSKLAYKRRYNWKLKICESVFFSC